MLFVFGNVCLFPSSMLMLVFILNSVISSKECVIKCMKKKNKKIVSF